MKAVVYERYGPPDVLRVEEIERPIPRDDEVLVRVRAAEVTKADCEMRSFRFQVKWFWLPLRIVLGISKPKRPVLGGYFAGEVEAVGKDVTRFKKGDQVFGSAQLRLGAHGEYVCLPARYTMVPKPHNASFEEAAAAILGGLNALHFMRRANIRPGEKVLVNGAGGSIGVYAVQIAKAMGAEVTAVDGAHKEQLLRGLGADHFVDYAREDFRTGGRRYDVIFSVVATDTYRECLEALNPKGRYVLANPRLIDLLQSAVTSALTDKKVIVALAGEKEEELLALKQMIEEGKIRPVVDRVYSMDQAPEAHRRVETEQRLGAVVLSPANA
jgi:NADPH:quinone reductase-like Zn-dependent oxidoreductase